MPAPTITPAPPAPLRSDSPATFTSKAEAFVEWQANAPDEFNALAEYLETLEGGTLSALLNAISAAGSSANKLAYYTGTNTVALADFTAFGRTLAALADAAALRTAGGLVIGTNVQAYSAVLAALAGLSLSQGDILYRDASGLARLPAGTAGSVLQTNGAGADPSWGTVNAQNIVYAKNSAAPRGPTSTAAFATKGQVLKPFYNSVISSVWFAFTPVTAATYIVGLYALGNDLTADAVTAVSTSRTGLPTTNDLYRFDFASPVALSANSRYALALTRTDSTTTYILPTSTSSSDANLVGLPIDVEANTLRLASVAPGIGSVFVDSGSTSSIIMAMTGTFAP